ncbi:MAG: UDP-N-acetylmuramoyl-L-alanine--D-glutamate ligase [Bdellovibrionota bacterium]
MKDVAGKKVMVVGLSSTGVALTKFLVEMGAKVTVSDHKSPAELSQALEKIDNLELEYDLGGHTPKLLLEQDMIILSPGVSPELKVFEYARKNGKKVTGDIEFAAQFIEEPIIAITGTNGKSTTCKLAELMLTESGVKVWLGGNFGTPLIEYVRNKEKADVVIVEASSFQLEHVDTFNPKNIVFMNIGENHLDRYRSMDEYVGAKRKLFRNTNHNTTSVLNADDNRVVDLARDPVVQRGRIFYFSRKVALEPQIMNIGGAVLVANREIKVRVGPEIETYSTANLKMRGKHAVENIMAAILTTRDFGAKHEAIQKVMDSFQGLAHRIEYVRKAGGVMFYNDSKATNVHAVKRALDCFDENVILIMGGKDSNLDFTELQTPIRQKVKNLILVGEAKEKINRDLGDFSETFLIGTFEEAVLLAYQKSRIGDTVLLSPGCPSFDTFDNYVERGNYFKKLVSEFS